MHSRLPTRPGQLHSCHRSLAPGRNRRATLSTHTSPHRFHAGCAPLYDAKPELAGTSLATHAEKETEYKARNCEKLLVHEQAEDRARESEGRCICFQPPLHVPFLVQLIDLAR